MILLDRFLTGSVNSLSSRSARRGHLFDPEAALTALELRSRGDVLCPSAGPAEETGERLPFPSLPFPRPTDGTGEGGERRAAILLAFESCRRLRKAFDAAASPARRGMLSYSPSVVLRRGRRNSYSEYMDSARLISSHSARSAENGGHFCDRTRRGD